MKYTMAAATLLLVIAGVVLVSRASMREQRVREHTETVRSMLAADSDQALARRYAACFPPQGTPSPKPDAAYCAEVEAASDARPLQLMQVRPARPLIRP